MMRLTVSAASTVWTVESTRWPVSAALSAVWTVSSSRISPMRITSGSWRRTRRSARLNECVSWPTSRWLMIERLSRCRNSIGSSIVTMWRAKRSFMWSIIAASVVDLPEPVVPVTRMIPRSSSASSRMTGGSAELVDRADVERDRAADDRDRAALVEGVDAEAGDALDRVGEVDLALLGELLALGRLLQELVQRALHFRGAQLLRVLVDCLEQPVDSDERAVAGLDVKVGTAAGDQCVKCLVDVEHMAAIGRCPGALQRTRRLLDARPGCCRWDGVYARLTFGRAHRYRPSDRARIAPLGRAVGLGPCAATRRSARVRSPRQNRFCGSACTVRWRSCSTCSIGSGCPSPDRADRHREDAPGPAEDRAGDGQRGRQPEGAADPDPREGGDRRRHQYAGDPDHARAQRERTASH